MTRSNIVCSLQETVQMVHLKHVKDIDILET